MAKMTILKTNQIYVLVLNNLCYICNELMLIHILQKRLLKLNFNIHHLKMAHTKYFDTYLRVVHQREKTEVATK